MLTEKFLKQMIITHQQSALSGLNFLYGIHFNASIALSLLVLKRLKKGIYLNIHGSVHCKPAIIEFPISWQHRYYTLYCSAHTINDCALAMWGDRSFMQSEGGNGHI